MLLVEDQGRWDPVSDSDIRGAFLAVIGVLDGATAVMRGLDRARLAADAAYREFAAAYLAGAVTAELHRLRGAWPSPNQVMRVVGDELRVFARGG